MSLSDSDPVDHNGGETHVPNNEPFVNVTFDMPLLDQLMNLDSAELILNMEPFDCLVCMSETKPGDGVTLKDCLHSFCRSCLVEMVNSSNEAEVKCPFADGTYVCDSVMRQSEVKALVPPQVYERHLTLSVSQAENRTDKAFHCKTPDCKGWWVVEEAAAEFKCPVCLHINCLTCEAIHEFQTCAQYAEFGDTHRAVVNVSKSMLEGMIRSGKAMRCPQCEAIIQKIGGCDGMSCSMCKTDLCWATRGRRWGPMGKGDNSGGCRCMVNGRRCHVSCVNCH